MMPGQNVPNPEGYATMSKFNLTREIFNILAQVFQINLQPKKITEVPESFILFKDKKSPIYQLKIVPYLRGSGLVPPIRRNHLLASGLTPQKFPSEQVIIPLSTILDLLRGQ